MDTFVRATSLVGLPGSIGDIYGCLYCNPKPLTFDEIQDQLYILRGSVLGGLMALRRLGAIKLHYDPVSREDHYLQELSMERLVRGFIKDQFSPHLESSANRLDSIEVSLAEESDLALRQHATERLNALRTWRRRAEKLLSLVLALIGGSRQLFSRKEKSTSKVV